ncbi:MAG: RNA-binding S4 domain-containing protein [Prolixibacteraceae bacterium]|nr:RNA-binding S4 domain-containing protein [Prolixibacteraceae bacterium]
MSQTIRIDKWLWAVRIYKTRSIAIEECKKGRITIEGIEVKPSRDLKIGDVLEIKKPPITYVFKVIQLTDKRMGAKMVPEYLEDLTPKEQFKVLEMQKMMQWSERDRGTGRPTKKERRDIDSFMDW